MNTPDRSVAGGPPVLDLVHLDHRRVRLTCPVLDRAGRIVRVGTGREKRAALARLLLGDPTVPSGQVRRDRAPLVADAEARLP